MEMRETRASPSSSFDVLFIKSLPHIFEKIFFSLDYESFKSCLEVSKSWNDLITAERFQRLGKSYFQEEIERDLWTASDNGSLSGVKRILSSFMVDVNCVRGRSNLETPLDQRSLNDMYRGTDPKNATADGSTPLYMAASNGHKDVVQLLLDREADPSRTNKDGETPLHQAAWKGHKDVVQLGPAPPGQRG